jgi:signal recognition particle subunit SRP54
VLIVDTSGRLHVDEALMAELANIKKRVQPHVVLLVVDAMTGQDASTSRSSSPSRAVRRRRALQARRRRARRRGAVGQGGHGQADHVRLHGREARRLREFHPDRMAQRILGMGDVLSFIEKAEQTVDEDEAKELERKLRSNEFTLEDFLEPAQAIRKMGRSPSLLGMIPGLAATSSPRCRSTSASLTGSRRSSCR